VSSQHSVNTHQTEEARRNIPNLGHLHLMGVKIGELDKVRDEIPPGEKRWLIGMKVGADGPVAVNQTIMP
jgi:hypothetical protein